MTRSLRRIRRTGTTSPRASAHLHARQAGRRTRRDGWFFDKTHFEVVGGLIPATALHELVELDVPGRRQDLGPRNGQFPTGIRFCCERARHQPRPARPDVPARFGDPRHVRDLGQPGLATRDSDEYSVGYEREIGPGGERGLHPVAEQGPVHGAEPQSQVRSNPNVSASTLTRVPSATLNAVYVELKKKDPGLRAVLRRRDAVRQYGTCRLRRGDVPDPEALQSQLQRASL